MHACDVLRCGTTFPTRVLPTTPDRSVDIRPENLASLQLISASSAIVRRHHRRAAAKATGRPRGSISTRAWRTTKKAGRSEQLARGTSPKTDHPQYLARCSARTSFDDAVFTADVAAHDLGRAHLQMNGRRAWSDPGHGSMANPWRMRSGSGVTAGPTGVSMSGEVVCYADGDLITLTQM